MSRTAVRQPNRMFLIYDHADDRWAGNLTERELRERGFDPNMIDAVAGETFHDSDHRTRGMNRWDSLVFYVRHRGACGHPEEADSMDRMGRRAVRGVHPPFQSKPGDTDEVVRLRAIIEQARALAKVSNSTWRVAEMLESVMWQYDVT